MTRHYRILSNSLYSFTLLFIFHFLLVRVTVGPLLSWTATIEEASGRRVTFKITSNFGCRASLIPQFSLSILDPPE
jgi:hypothetical protein